MTTAGEQRRDVLLVQDDQRLVRALSLAIVVTVRGLGYRFER